MSNGTELAVVATNNQQVAAKEETTYDIDLASKYGDILPEAITGFGSEDDLYIPSTEAVTPASTEVTTVTPTEGQSVSPQPVTTPQQPAATPDRNDALLAQVSTLVQTLQNSQTQVDQTPKETPLDTFVKIPEYDFEIPDNLINALNSEQPAERKQATGILIKAVAQTIHQQVVASVKELWKTIPQEVGQGVQMAMLQERVTNSFYGAYPKLNTTERRATVQAIARAMMAEDLSKGIQPQWNEAFMKRVGNHVMQMYGEAIQTPQPTKQAPSPATFGGTGGGGISSDSKLAKGRTTQQDYIDNLL